MYKRQTEWSSEFFTRLGFSWYDHEEDEHGNLFFFGTHTVCPGDDRVFRKILSNGGVTVDFGADTNTTAEQDGADQPATAVESKAE